MELLSTRSSDIAFTMGDKRTAIGKKQKTMMVKFRFFKCNNFQYIKEETIRKTCK